MHLCTYWRVQNGDCVVFLLELFSDAAIPSFEFRGRGLACVSGVERGAAVSAVEGGGTVIQGAEQKHRGKESEERERKIGRRDRASFRAPWRHSERFW
jgi:hypothetical protein